MTDNDLLDLELWSEAKDFVHELVWNPDGYQSEERIALVGDFLGVTRNAPFALLSGALEQAAGLYWNQRVGNITLEEEDAEFLNELMWGLVSVLDDYSWTAWCVDSGSSHYDPRTIPFIILEFYEEARYLPSFESPPFVARYLESFVAA